MNVEVESEDQEDIVTNTPSKRRTRAMRIVDDDDDTPGEEEEEYEIDEEEEDADGVRLQSLAARVVSNHVHWDSQRRTSWSRTRNQNLRFQLLRR